MKNFLENIFAHLNRDPGRIFLQEVTDGGLKPTSAGELMSSTRRARAFLRKKGISKGDRCVLLARNSVNWVAMDLAILAEGAVAVPLYARQSPAELVSMMQDSEPCLIFCGDDILRKAISQHWPDAPPIHLLGEEQAQEKDPIGIPDAPLPLADEAPLSIIYTSGSSGEPKGVLLNLSNLNHMLPCTTARLNLLMEGRPEQVFHYLPFCFAGSWILLLSCLSRDCVLTLSMDLTRLADEMRLADPHYLLNVPTLLERIRDGVENQFRMKGGISELLYRKGRDAWLRRYAGKRKMGDPLWLTLGRRLIFPAVKKKLGGSLKALICGSAALAEETQLFFMMIGLPVLQVYGLTETTAICTMDDPNCIVPGWVGPTISGVEMKLGANDEILVKGPNVFSGYWNRPQATADCFQEGWFRTGDRGEVNQEGYWRLVGRIKNLIVLRSGHNVAPEPIEETLLQHLPGAQQILLVGQGQSFLGAVMTGDLSPEQVETALQEINPELPHYKRIHAFHIRREPFTIENGLLTANGKLKREEIISSLDSEIQTLYEKADQNG